MARVIAVVWIGCITFQCFMHTSMVGYHHTTIFWWLINFVMTSLLWDGYKVKR